MDLDVAANQRAGSVDVGRSSNAERIRRARLAAVIHLKR